MRTDPRGFPSWPEAVTASLRGRIHYRGRFFTDKGSLRIRGGPYIFAEDNRLNVYAGELEVRPPLARQRRVGSDLLRLAEIAADQIWARPPSTKTSLPVMKLLWSEAKNSATAAVSDGSPRGPTAV